MDTTLRGAMDTTLMGQWTLRGVMDTTLKESGSRTQGQRGESIRLVSVSGFQGGPAGRRPGPGWGPSGGNPMKFKEAWDDMAVGRQKSTTVQHFGPRGRPGPPKLSNPFNKSSFRALPLKRKSAPGLSERRVLQKK